MALPATTTPLEHDQVFLEDVQGILRTVLDHMPSRIFWKDKELRYLGCNRAFAEDVGLDHPDDAIGRTDFEVSWGQKDAERYQADDREVMETGIPKSNYEEPQERDGGRIEWLETSKRPLYSIDGELVGVLGTYQIITERKEAEIQLREAQEAAEKANSIKSEFLATMSHEIRSPLNVLLGYTDLLKSAETDPEKLGMLQTMVASGQCLRDIINDILDLSKIESQEVDIKAEPFSPEEIIRRQYDIMESVAVEKGIGYAIEIDPSVPKLILSDAPRWSQIIRNLISNAVKFTTEGSVKIRLSAKPICTVLGTSTIIATVTDSGIGMSPETVAKLFQKFYRSDSSAAREFGGTGLGLYISRGIARLLGGDVYAESAPGVGSTFTAKICSTIVEEKEVAAASPGIRHKLPQNRESIEIIVVDDMPSNLLLVRAFLKQAGFGCHTFSDANSALAHLQDSPADIIFTDIEMPRCNGLDFARVLRERGVTSPASGDPSTIVAITAGVLPEERQRCFDAGMDSYISKPFQIDDLTAAIALAS